MTTKNSQKGDTIVEVIVAFAVFAVVAVSVSVLMNRGLAIGQQSLEVFLVREQISAQAEMLRFARYDEEQVVWDEVLDRTVVGSIAAEKPTQCETAPAASERAFVLYAEGDRLEVKDVDSGTYSSPVMNSFVENNGTPHGLWIQAADAENQSHSGRAGYDFYIHACWYVPTSDRPQTLTTMVRLYG